MLVYFPFIILVFNGLCWGFSFSLAKITANNLAHPLGVAFWQSLIASIILGILLFFILKKQYKITIQHLKLYLILSLVGLVLPGILFYYAAAKVPSGILAILITITPIITYALALPLKLELFSYKRIIGVLLGLISILIFVLPEQTLPDPQMIPWIFVGCFCASCYALQGIVISFKFDNSDDPIVMAFWMNVFSALILMPFQLFEGTRVSINLPLNIVGLSIISLGIIEAIGFTLQMFLITRSGAVFASQVGYIVTLSGVFWGIIIFGEKHNFLVILSLVLMLLGLAMVSPKEN